MERELEKMGKAMPFTVPDGFFDEMQQRIWQAIDREQRKRNRTKFIAWSMSAAAATVIAVTATLAFFKPIAPTTTTTLLASNETAPVVAETIAQQPSGIETVTINSNDPEVYMTDEELDEWVTINEMDEFMQCENYY